MATIVNRPDYGDYGTMFKTVPETTQNFANRITCFKIPGSKDAKVTAQGVLPDLTNYKVRTYVILEHACKHTVTMLCV